MEAQKIKFTKYGGILYTDKITFTGTDVVEVQKISFTTDEALIGIRINQVSARHIRPEIVMVRDKK